MLKKILIGLSLLGLTTTLVVKDPLSHARFAPSFEKAALAQSINFVKSPAVSWTPCGVSGSQWDIDFSDSSTLSPGSITDGTIITNVVEKCSSLNFTSGVNLRPIYKTAIKNSLSVARFDGVNDYVGHTFGGNFTSFTIAFEIKMTTWHRFDAILGSTNNPTGQLTFEGGATHSFDSYISNVGNTTSTGNNSQVDGTWYRLVQTYDGTTLTTYINNGTGTTATTSSRDIDAIVNIGWGGNASFTALNGDIGEAMGWNVVLGSSDLTSLDNYLTAKWGT